MNTKSKAERTVIMTTDKTLPKKAKQLLGRMLKHHDQGIKKHKATIRTYDAQSELIDAGLIWEEDNGYFYLTSKATDLHAEGRL